MKLMKEMVTHDTIIKYIIIFVFCVLLFSMVVR